MTPADPSPVRVIRRVVTVTLNTAIDRVIEVPGLTVGGHVPGREVSRFPAGKAINVSRALARLGQPSIATGFVGEDQAETFERFLASSGPGRIQSQLLSVRGKTRENLTLLDPEARTDTHIRDRGFEVTSSDIQRLQNKLALLSTPDTAMVFSGSLPPGLGVQTFEETLFACQQAGVALVLDVGGNLLSNIAGGVDSTDGVPRIQGWLTKPNRSELAEFAGKSNNQAFRDFVTPARRLAERFDWVIVSTGEEGAWLISQDQVFQGSVSIGQDRIVQTVGCGDCLIAGFLDGVLTGRSPQGMLERGLAVATANALSARIASFDPDHLQAVREHVSVKPKEA